MGSRRLRVVGGWLVTGLAGLIILAAFGALLIVLVNPPDGESTARTQTATADRATMTVGGRGCSDVQRKAGAGEGARPWCTLGRAVAAARPGEVIELVAGRHAAVSVAGRRPSGKRVTVTGAAGGRTVVGGLTLADSGGLRFAHVTFTGPVQIRNGDGITLDHNDLRGAGIAVTTSRRITIASNHIHDVRGEQRGIYFRGSFAPGQPDNADVIVRDNRIERLDHDGIAFYNGYRNVLVEGNTISRVIQPKNFPLHSDGMQFMGGDRLTVRDNVIRDVSKQGMFVKDGQPSVGLVISRNVIFNVAGPGMQVFSAPRARISRNTIWSTKLGSFIGNDPKVDGNTSAALRDNVLDRLTVLAPGAVSQAARNVFRAGKPVGRPAYVGTPHFRDARRGDLRIVRDRPGAGIPKGRTPPGAQRKLD